MALPVISNFSLVGGTALSLLYGHRISVDLDFFSNTPFDNDTVVNGLTEYFGERFFYEEKAARFGIFCFIDEIKVDIVRHPHPLIRDQQMHEGVRMFSLEDIVAMKVQAILGRGKKKDFWDIAELLKYFTVEDFIRFHKEKYSKQTLLISIPNVLTYFGDADESENPVSLKKQTWDSVKTFIQKKVSEYLR